MCLVYKWTLFSWREDISGNEIDERECEECGEIDTCYECIEEDD